MDDNPRERLSNSSTLSVETQPYWLISYADCCPLPIYSDGLAYSVLSVAL